jgi:hypothetical protein
MPEHVANIEIRGRHPFGIVGAGAKTQTVSNHGFAIDEDRRPAAQTADVIVSMLRFWSYPG